MTKEFETLQNLEGSIKELKDAIQNRKGAEELDQDHPNRARLIDRADERLSDCRWNVDQNTRDLTEELDEIMWPNRLR